MRRDTGALAQGFDVLVVGAGVHGACIARVAALSGLSVAIIDRGDFGAATSRNSAKLLHGGIRYLQHFDVPRIRDSVRAQRAWFRFAPQLVRPLRVVIPTYGIGTRGPAALAAGMAAFHVLAADRNRGIPRSARLPRSGLMSRRRLVADHPAVAGAGATGGAWWYDGQMMDATRLTLECIRDATDAGAVAANHVTCRALLAGRAGISGVAAQDRLSGKEIEIRAGLTINATGPWVDRVLETGPEALRGGDAATWTLNTNLVTRKLYDGEVALGVASRRASDAAIGESKRLFFASPWHGCTIVGTTHALHDGGPDSLDALDDVVAGFLEEIRDAAPGMKLDPADVRSVHAGLTPAEGEAQGRARRSLLVDHQEEHGIGGLISVAGVKFTTAPIVAEKVVGLALGKLQRTGPVKSFAQRGSAASESPDAVRADDSELAWARRIYGTRADQLLGEPSESSQQHSNEVFRCRLRFGIEQEMVVRLSDAVLRATDWAERGLLTTAQLEWSAQALAEAHGWSRDLRERELADTRAELGRLRIRLLD